MPLGWFVAGGRKVNSNTGEDLMRPGQQKQRSRGRNSGGGDRGGSSHNNNNNNNNGNRKGQNPLTRTYDSSGPDVKIRGTAQNIAEKYMTLARDATSSGDRVMAENYLQHAEHYNRIIAAAQAMFQERFQREERPEGGERQEQGERQEFGDRQDYNERDDDDNDNGQQDNYQPAPRQQHVPVEQPRPVIDASTPQPVIEGTPAEVQIEEEATAREGAGGAAPARRRNAGRPRRTPRPPVEGAEVKPAAESGQPVDVPAE